MKEVATQEEDEDKGIGWSHFFENGTFGDFQELLYFAVASTSKTGEEGRAIGLY